MNLILLVLSIINLVCLLFLLKHTDKVIESVRDDTHDLIYYSTKGVWQEIEKLKRKIEEKK